MAWITDSLRSAIGAVSARFTHGRSDVPGSLNGLDHQLAYAAYMASGMLRKVVNIPAEDRVREWRDWQADSDDIGKIEAEEKRLGLRAKVKHAEMLRSVGGGAIIIIAPGGHDRPLTPALIAEKGIVALNVASRWQITAHDFVRDFASPDYGTPSMFEISGQAGAKQRIHPSRVIAFRGAPLPAGAAVAELEAFWGDSRLLRVYREVQNADNAQEWFAALVKKAKLLRIGIPDLLDLISTTEGKARLDARVALVAEGENSLNATIYRSGTGKDGDAGEVINDYQVNWTGIPAMMDAFDQRVAAVADIPFTRLMGRSPAGMNATGQYDDQNWAKMIAAGQELETRPCLEHLDPLLLRSAGVAKPDDVWWRWAPLNKPSEKEETERFKTFLEGADKLAAMGAMPDRAFNAGVQGVIEENGWMPAALPILAAMGENERFGLSSDDDGTDPSAITQSGSGEEGGDPILEGGAGGDGSAPARRAVNDKAIQDRKGGTPFGASNGWSSQPRVPAGSARGGEWAGGKGGGGRASGAGRGSAQPAGSSAAPKPAKPSPASSSASAAGPVLTEAKAHGAAQASVSARQKEALANYAGAGFRDVNPALRSGKRLSRDDAKDVSEMDKVFAGAKTTADIAVYRGVSSEVAAKLSPGSTFVDRAFTSTSSSRAGAENFARGDGAAVMKIRVPKGSRAISMMDHSVFSKAEREILLNRGGSYRVTKVTPGRGRKPAVIEVEYAG